MSDLSKIKRNVRDDINRINETLKTQSYDELLKIHNMIDAKYQSKIEMWGKSLYDWSEEYGFYYNCISKETLIDNLETMKNKLESYLTDLPHKYFQEVNSNFKNITCTKVYNKVINNANTMVSINFENIRQEIINNEMLNSVQTNDCLKKIDEVEEIVKSSDDRKNKWEKLRRIIVWLADKSVDVAVSLLPIIYKALENK